MLITTTHHIDGKPVQEHLGLVTGEAILGANIFRDLFASIRDVVGGRAGAYERTIREARDIALREMQDEADERGADAVIGVGIAFQQIGEGMLMVAATGTAVRLSLRVR